MSIRKGFGGRRARRLGMASVAFGVTVLAVPAPASAQVLEEVVVTAQKREQEVQDVGIAISAFSGDQIEALGFTDSTDIASMTPGVNVSGSSAGQTREFTIRGVTQNDFSDIAENPNAVYVDEGYIAFRQGVVFANFDMERVEILKGPQGTLFGRNATGGLVHFITRKPTDAFEAFGDITYGRYNKVRFEGAVSGPLAENFKGRLSVLYQRHDEIMDNDFPDQLPVNPAPGGPAWFGSPGGGEDNWNDDQWAIRGQGTFDFAENGELWASGFASEQQVSSGPYQDRGTTAVIDQFGRHVNTIFAENDPNRCEAISAETSACLPIGLVDGEGPGPIGAPGIPGITGPEDGLRPAVGGDLFGYVDRDGDGFDTSTDHSSDDFNRYRTQGGTVRITYDFSDDLKLTTVSHYMHNYKRQSLDVDAGPVPQTIVMNEETADSFAQELRLNGTLERARWVAGAYYLYIKAGYNQGLANSPGGPFTTSLYAFLGNIVFGIPGPIPPLDGNTLSTLKTNSYSLFGQVDVDLTDTLTFIAGIRTIWEKKSFDYDNQFFLNTNDFTVDTETLFPFPTAYGPFEDKSKETLWTGKLALEWTPIEDVLLYASINRGVKGQGYNAPLNDGSPRLSDADFSYDPEVLLAYEVGFKSTLFGGTTRFNGSYYYYDYTDYQAFLFKGSAGAVFNNPATIQGIELEMITSPIDNLDFLVNLSLIDAEVSNLAIAGSVGTPGTPGFVPAILKDVEPTFTPSVHWATLLRYAWPGALFGGEVAVQADANYSSHRYHNIRNHQSAKMDSYILGNVRLSWTSADERWQTSAFVENVGDERYVNIGFELPTLCGCNEESYGTPRWWGIQARYSWH